MNFIDFIIIIKYNHSTGIYKMKDKKLDEILTVNNLKEKVKSFCHEREWDQFHNAKDLIIAMIIEVGELLEIFRWKNINETEEVFKNPDKLEKVKDEVADILFFILRLAQKYEIDLSSSLLNKIEKNKIKYPVEKFKGSNKKYDEV